MEKIFDFIVRLATSLAWPFVSALFLLIFKEQIKRVILLIERFKVKDVEVFFQKDAEGVVESLQNEGSGTIDVQQEELSKSPKDAVISAWIKLENASEKKYEELFSTDNKKVLGPDRFRIF